LGIENGVSPAVLTQPSVAVTPPVQSPVGTTPPSMPARELTAPASSMPARELTAPTSSALTPMMDTQAGAIATNNSSLQNPALDVTNPTAGQSQSGSNSSSIINANSDTQQILQRTAILNSGSITVAANSETLTMLEDNRTQEFSDYLGLDPSEQLNSTKSVREILVDIEKQIGNRSAVVYVTAHAESLQIVLYTASGEPILKTVPDASREAVLELVKDLNYKIVSPRFRYGKAYLQPAQQLYQWLIAPIAAELEAANIDTLLFSMDKGIRTLPVAALHDGERFLVENYSLSIIPSVSLMDSRYRSLEDTRVLAMGASQFVELNPLPAVPVELQTIAQQLWQGQTRLNEEFTVENLIAQRQDYAYPIIHLATHGQFLPGEPGNSYIQFWGEEKLTLDRVRELGLNNPPVELLILSACRTAVGDTNAELGFAGLAVAAGVKSAIASLWYVSDEGTLGLMTEFYSHLDDVTIKAEALRQAQLAMLRAEVKIEDGQLRGSGQRGGVLMLPPALAHIVNADLSHPYYWSAFTAIGSPW
jgi:CHAT domain-containing protein